MRPLSAPVLDLTASAAAGILQRVCYRSPDVAIHMAAKRGLRGDVTTKFIKEAFKDTFNSKGRLKTSTKKALREAFKEMGLKENASLRTLLKRAKTFELPIDLSFTEKDLRIL